MKQRIIRLLCAVQLMVVGLALSGSVVHAESYSGVTITATCSGFTATGTIQGTGDVEVISIGASDSAGWTILGGPDTISLPISATGSVPFPSGTFDYPFPHDGVITVTAYGFPGGTFVSSNTVSGCRGGANIPPAPNYSLAVPTFTDGRCNQNAAQTVAVYPDKKGGYLFYAVHNGVGDFALHVTEQQLDDNPAKSSNYLIAQNLGVQLYRLVDGSLQVNRMGRDHKVYSYFIGSCSALED